MGLSYHTKKSVSERSPYQTHPYTSKTCPDKDTWIYDTLNFPDEEEGRDDETGVVLSLIVILSPSFVPKKRKFRKGATEETLSSTPSEPILFSGNRPPPNWSKKGEDTDTGTNTVVDSSDGVVNPPSLLYSDRSGRGRNHSEANFRTTFSNFNVQSQLNFEHITGTIPQGVGNVHLLIFG